MKSFPETVLFIGAGATAQLGMPQSDSQSKFFRALVEPGHGRCLEDVFADYNFESRDLEVMIAFIRFLGDNLEKNWCVVEDEDVKNARVVFGNDADEKLLRSRVMELRREYDWNALKQIIKVCPHDKIEDNLIRDVYTMIDMKLRDKQGITVTVKNGDTVLIEPGRLPKARNCLILFTNILFANAWYRLSKGKNAEQFQKYVAFNETVAKIMQKEGRQFADKYGDFTKPAFYNFSNAIITLNFETVFLWLLFNANRKVNSNGFYLPQTSQKMEQWLFFGVSGKSRKISDKSEARSVDKFSYSQDETSVFRNNECRVSGSPIWRIGSFFFAHGCCNWRECPSCGRMMYYLGDEWGYNSKHLNPPFPVPLFENVDFNRTEKEKEWKKRLRYDSLECISCSAETIASDAPMIMQTMIKGMPTSFLDEVQRESRVLLRKARHIVLFGYQLPPDDVLWQEAFSEAVRCRKGTDDEAFCTVVVGYLGEKRWIQGDEMMAFVKKHRYSSDAASLGVKAIINAVAIFGENRVRAYCGGIPDVWGNASESEVREILYPSWVNWQGTRLE
ncbi:hypothetical protein [Fibrobacter sp.]|uniref:hypothetical protein n=1 Tax=Fibrobacter sp. TaxID=35828 RepID=UPI0025BDBB7F|nr:hypothetical protein [Fibrobacter sp.]MBR3072826.1 hypothetical protein [Fibrobacter sp.]